MNFEQALQDPAGSFSKPASVCEAGGWSREQKIQVLRRWEYDARELLVAEEENMGGGNSGSAMLDQVLEALRRLDADKETAHSAPTKQGGD